VVPCDGAPWGAFYTLEIEGRSTFGAPRIRVGVRARSVGASRLLTQPFLKSQPPRKEVRMRVADLMLADLFVVPASASVAEGLQRAWERNVHHVLVTDRKRLVGVVCTCDLEKAALDQPIAHVISRPPEIIWPESSLRDAAERFVRKSVGCLPVCDGEQLVGVITRADIVRSRLPGEDLPGGFCCVFCADTRHVRPMPGQPGLGVCLDCRSRGFSLSLYDSPDGQARDGASRATSTHHNELAERVERRHPHAPAQLGVAHEHHPRWSTHGGAVTRRRQERSPGRATRPLSWLRAASPHSACSWASRPAKRP